MNTSLEPLRRTLGPRFLDIVAVPTFAQRHISITALQSLPTRNILTSCDRIRTSAPSPQAAVLCGLGIYPSGNESAERTYLCRRRTLYRKREEHACS